MNGITNRFFLASVLIVCMVGASMAQVKIDDQGNVTLMGTVTASKSLAVTGQATAGSLVTTGAVSANSLSVTNAANVGSLAVSGQATADSLVTTGAVSAKSLSVNGSVVMQPVFASCQDSSQSCKATATCPAGTTVKSGWATYLVDDSPTGGWCGLSTKACTVGDADCSTTSEAGQCTKPKWGNQMVIVSISCG